MPEPQDPIDRLPDVVRESNRPIIIYQGGPPPSYIDARTSSALGVLAWMALLTVCLAVGGFSAWTIWNPGFDKTRFSPIFAEGHPRGLSGQIDERQQINAWTAGLVEFRDQIRAGNDAGRPVSLTHPLVTDRQGINLDHQGVDALRQQWDVLCNSIRARIFDRRFEAIDIRVEQLQERRGRTMDATERQSIEDALQSLKLQRADLVERRRTDSDPALRCTPAAQADMCSDSNADAWCNPQMRRPEEFADDE